MDFKHDKGSDIYTFDFFYVGLNLTRYQAKQLIALIQEKCPELFVCKKCQERERNERKES